MDGHRSAENAKEYINLPLDVLERGRNKVSESEVKDPVGGGTESDGTATDTEGEQLRRIGPRDRTPGNGERGDKQVRAGDDGLGGGTANFPAGCWNTAKAARRRRVTVSSEKTTVGKQPGHH